MAQPAITWQAVEAEALRRIRSREWPAGSPIPNEADLARELGCARATVNRALRELAAAGLIERRRKAGSRVAATPVRKATFEIPIIRQDIAARGLEPGYELISRTLAPPPPEVRLALRLHEPAPMLHLVALHRASGQPFCIEDRWINPDLDGIEVADFAVQSANEWLVRNTAFSGGDIAFFALTAEAAASRMLGCAPGVAVFGIERTTWAGAQSITAVRLTYAPGYRMVTAI